jgi:hypothetical protein
MSTKPIAVPSRGELVKFLRENPMQLIPSRPSRRIRAGHPDFIGPLKEPEQLLLEGVIRFDVDASPYIELPGLPRSRSFKKRRQPGSAP